MDINKLKIDRSLKKRLNQLLEEFEASKILDVVDEPKTYLQKLFS